MSTITIIVGNIGKVLETTDAKEASDIYCHYCDASDRGEGRMARENVTMMFDAENGVDWYRVVEHVGYDARLESIDGFMKPQITVERSWWSVDTRCGIWYVDCEDIADKGFLLDFTECQDDINDVERVKGYGARLSASGYLDCTDWTVHNTKHDAIVHLVDTYADADGPVNDDVD